MLEIWGGQAGSDRASDVLIYRFKGQPDPAIRGGEPAIGFRDMRLLNASPQADGVMVRRPRDLELAQCIAAPFALTSSSSASIKRSA